MFSLPLAIYATPINVNFEHVVPKYCVYTHDPTVYIYIYICICIYIHMFTLCVRAKEAKMWRLEGGFCSTTKKYFVQIKRYWNGQLCALCKMEKC